jgi:hypothetical protein
MGMVAGGRGREAMRTQARAGDEYAGTRWRCRHKRAQAVNRAQSKALGSSHGLASRAIPPIRPAVVHAWRVRSSSKLSARGVLLPAAPRRRRLPARRVCRSAAAPHTEGTGDEMKVEL